MNLLPIGMYQPGNSIIYKLNAVTKIIAMLILLVSVIFTDSLLGYGVQLLFLCALIIISKIDIGVAFDLVKRLKWFFLIILFMNICFFSADKPWFSFWIFKPSYEGLMQGIHVVACVIFALITGSILTITTTPLELTDAIGRLLSPLKIFHIPTGQISMIISVAIQFIPTLSKETDMIRKAQMARGAGFDSSRLKDKAGAVLPLIIPVFVAAFRRADELSMAMEARGYRTDVCYEKDDWLKLELKDVFALFICIALCVVQIVI